MPFGILLAGIIGGSISNLLSNVSPVSTDITGIKGGAAKKTKYKSKADPKKPKRLSRTREPKYKGNYIEKTIDLHFNLLLSIYDVDTGKMVYRGNNIEKLNKEIGGWLYFNLVTSTKSTLESLIWEDHITLSTYYLADEKLKSIIDSTTSELPIVSKEIIYDERIKTTDDLTLLFDELRQLNIRLVLKIPEELEQSLY